MCHAEIERKFNLRSWNLLPTNKIERHIVNICNNTQESKSDFVTLGPSLGPFAITLVIRHPASMLDLLMTQYFNL